jgi:hypothetical protein
MYEELISRTLPDALDTWNDQTRWYSEFVQELKDALIATTVDRNYWQTNAGNSRRNHQSDIKMIGEALIEEANNRGWCDDYDKFVGSLNGRLSITLEERSHDYEVTATFIVTVSTTISARDEDDANDQAGDMDLSSFNCSIRGDYDDIEYSNHEIELA